MPAEVNQKLMDLHLAISAHLNEIKAMFKGPVKVTIIIRTSEEPEGNVVVTEDDLNTVVGQLAIAENWKPTIKPGDMV